MSKSRAVQGSTIQEVKTGLQSTSFIREPAKKQYKTVNGKRFVVFCGCEAISKGLSISANHPNFWKASCVIVSYRECPKCKCASYIDITSLNLPERSY